MNSTENNSLTLYCRGKVRVLMANEPRAYRESISEVLCALRADLKVISVSPDTLEESVAFHAPHLVVCSAVIQSVRNTVPVWVELYPGHSSGAIISIDGERTEIEDIQLPELLSIVDQAYALAQPS